MRGPANYGERQAAAQMHALAAVRREILSHDPSSRRKYLREYSQAFRSYDAVLNPAELEQKIAAADVLLVGDYHALPASQRYAATLIEQVALRRPVVLGIEAVLSRDQVILDGWWRREFDEQDLRKRLRFDHEWGYAWEPFLELLASARDHAEGAYGLDCLPRNDMRRIRSRDRHAATKIREIRERHPEAAIVVLFGESHMAPEHLPRLLKQALPDHRVLTILQNVDALYWKAVAENAAAVGIDSDTICVFNSSPLEKYENYRLCLARWKGDEHGDFAPAVYNLIFSLARSLGFRADSPHNGTQPKYLADSLPDVVAFSENTAEKSEEMNSVADAIDQPARERIEQGGCAYVARVNTFYVREFNASSTAAEAARFLHHACRGMAVPRGLEASEFEDAVAHFGSRLLSPGTSAPDTNAPAENLYQAYLQRRVTKAQVRKFFLAHIEEAEQEQALIAQLRTL